MRRIMLVTMPFPFMQSLNEGIAAGSKRVGTWQIQIQFSAEPAELVKFAKSKRFDGVIVTYRASWLGELLALGLPVVSALAPNEGVPSVLLDERAIGAMGAEHLIGCGYRSFAFYGSSENWSIERYEGFRETLSAAGFGVSATLAGTLDGPDARPGSGAVTPEQFIRGLRTPVALMACHDAAGRQIVDAAIELGLRVPGDLAVLGVDNDELLCETGACPLSSIDPNLYRLGFEASLLLDRRLRGDTDSNPGICPPRVTPKEVVRRQSTSVFAHNDPEIAAALRLIHERACGGLSVTAVCEHLGMSRRRFEQRFLEAVGRPPGVEIRSVRIERAKALLTETNLTTVEIARRCGYAQVEGFSAAFRGVVGKSPARFRRQQEVGAALPDEGTAPPSPPATPRGRGQPARS